MFEVMPFWEWWRIVWTTFVYIGGVAIALIVLMVVGSLIAAVFHEFLPHP